MARWHHIEKTTSYRYRAQTTKNNMASAAAPQHRASSGMASWRRRMKYHASAGINLQHRAAA